MPALPGLTGLSATSVYKAMNRSERLARRIQTELGFIPGHQLTNSRHTSWYLSKLDNTVQKFCLL